MVESRIPSEAAAHDAPGIRELFSEVSHELSKLVRLEAQLAKEEVKTAARSQTRALALIGVGGFLLAVNVAILEWTAIAALARVLPAWLACLIVAAVGLATGAVLVLRGRSKLAPHELAPTETQETVRRSMQYLANRVRPAMREEGAAAHALEHGAGAGAA